MGLQALTSRRRALEFVQLQGLPLVIDVVTRYKANPSAVYHGCYVVYETLLRVKDVGVRLALQQEGCLPAVMALVARSLKSAACYADRLRPWQDACEMAMRLITETTIAFGADVVRLLREDEAAAEDEAWDIVGAVCSCLRAFEGIEAVEKFAFWFLAALFRVLNQAEAVPRWLLCVWPLVVARRADQERAEELHQLLLAALPA
jgi:hypothetical protein